MPCVPRSLLFVFLASFLPGTVAAQSGPGQGALPTPGDVFVPKRGWVTPDVARAAGYIEYRGRWFPKAMKRKLARWARDEAKGSGWAYARRLDTKHYRVLTDMPRYLFEADIRPFLDELYRAYTRVFKSDFGVKSKAANKKFINLHFGYESYARANAVGGEPRPRTNPGFIIGGSKLVLYYDLAEPDQFYGAMFHEGAHQFVAAMLPGARFPLWINEALATYFEGCTYSRTTREVAVDYLPPPRLRLAKHLLRQRRDGVPKYTLYDVLTCPDENFGAEFYALSWSFTYFMTHGADGKRRKRYMKFLREMNGAGVKRTPEEIFARTVKEEPLALAEEWRAFVHALKSERDPNWPIVGRVKAPAGLELDIRRGDYVHAIGGVLVESEKELAALMKRRPTDRPIVVELIRRERVGGPAVFDGSLVTVTIPAGADVRIEPRGIYPRRANLVR